MSELDDGVADLHMHTTASDGTCSVADRVSQAVERGLDAIAITDHDRISDDLTGRSEHRDGVEVVTGIEIRADCLGTKVEILGYFVDPSDPALRETIATVREFRRERNRRLVENVNDAAGTAMDYEAMRERADGMLGRPHVAQRLVDEGLVDSIGAAFDGYLATDGDAYVEMERLDAPVVIDAIHAAGGVASLAHPGRIRADGPDAVAAIVDSLVDDRLDAIEVPYPYGEIGHGGYAAVSVEDAATLAGEHGLLRTGGSDCHGPDSGKFRIGTVRLGQSDLDALRDRATSHKRKE